MKRGKAIVEIGFEITESELKWLEGRLILMGIPYYIKPQRRDPYISLEDLKCNCEGK